VILAILLLAPGILASSIYCRERGIALRSVDFLVHAASFVFLIDVFVIGASYLRGHGAAPIESMFSTIASHVKFGVLALVAAVAFPYALLLFDAVRGAIRDAVGKRRTNG
jgi:hypothetical protein